MNGANSCLSSDGKMCWIRDDCVSSTFSDAELKQEFSAVQVASCACRIPSMSCMVDACTSRWANEAELKVSS